VPPEGYLQFLAVTDTTGASVISNIPNSEPKPITFAPMTKKERDHRAYQLLRAAREAASALRCPSDESVKKTVKEVCRQTAELLGLPPGEVPDDAATQQKFVKAAGELAVLLRAYNWADSDISVTDLEEATAVPHAGERGAAESFDALGKLILPHASPAGWASELVTEAAKGNAKLEAAVKFGKYLLHPTPLLVLNDLTQIAGQAVHSLNIKRLNACVSDLCSLMKEGPLAELPGLGGLEGEDVSIPLPPPPEPPPSPKPSPPYRGPELDERAFPGEGSEPGGLSTPPEPGLNDGSLYRDEGPGPDDSTSLAHENHHEPGIDGSNTGLGRPQSFGGQGNRARRRRDLPGACTPAPRQPPTETQSPLASPGTPVRRAVRPCPSPDAGRELRPDVLIGDLGKTREGGDVITPSGKGLSQHDPAVSTHEDRHDTGVDGVDL
jgi:hypothetical protein